MTDWPVLEPNHGRATLPFVRHGPEIPLKAINQGLGMVAVSNIGVDTRHSRLNYLLGASLVEVFFGFLALKQQYHGPVDLIEGKKISDLVGFPTIHRHVLLSSSVSL
jgi:hypothetical protein